ncbi:hypothetical protein W02_08510 [Nitrospira sp. KM1]|nr:hypothetical protein W02_08510 [Nitrospira sp. KM1]
MIGRVNKPLNGKDAVILGNQAVRADYHQDKRDESTFGYQLFDRPIPSNLECRSYGN